jgi:drug/metabolite transporter (DMT)-like permease
MPRIIEIVLFLTPFLGFAAWRLVFPSPTPPLWLVGGLAGLVLVMLLTLVLLRHLDAGDATQSYIPAQLRDGLVVPAQRTPRQ